MKEKEFKGVKEENEKEHKGKLRERSIKYAGD